MNGSPTTMRRAPLRSFAATRLPALPDCFSSRIQRVKNQGTPVPRSLTLLSQAPGAWRSTHSSKAVRSYQRERSAEAVFSTVLRHTDERSVCPAHSRHSAAHRYKVSVPCAPLLRGHTTLRHTQ
jgi:hypothetical protein